MELLRCFYIATDRGIAIFSEDFQKIASYPRQDSDFCKYIRTDPKADAICVAESTATFAWCKETKKPRTRVCHIGLTETTVPILHENVVLGYLMIGQTLHDTMDKLWPGIKENCQPYNYDMNKLKRALAKIEVEGQERMLACAKIMEICAAYLLLTKAATLTLDDISEQLDEYINSNLAEDLSIDRLCKRFRISKTTVYNLSKRSYGKSIHEFISSHRIEAAKNY